MPQRILVVDDEPIVTEVVERYLCLNVYEVKTSGDGGTALEVAREWSPDLVILDLMLPVVDGLEVCQRLRARGPVAIIMLTAKGEEFDRIIGLELGADDYVVKPFSPSELVARVKSVLRRTGNGAVGGANQSLCYGDLFIDPMARVVQVAGKPVEFTAKEFDLLYYLASHPDQVFSREELMNRVWDIDYAAEYNTVTVHIRRLRARIEENPDKPRFIKTIWGIGYKFTDGTHGNNT
jgi:two-component system response regulator ResD